MAWRAGLGWIGKNSMLIHREHGSFLMLGSLLLNKNLFPDENPIVETDHCGTCRACVDACPTEAIDPDSRTLMAEECISTFTIEHFKNDVSPPRNYHLKNRWFFGCDICQDICPWNGKPLSSSASVSFAKPLEERLLQFFFDPTGGKNCYRVDEYVQQGFCPFFQGNGFCPNGAGGIAQKFAAFQTLSVVKVLIDEEGFSPLISP